MKMLVLTSMSTNN